MLRSTFDKMLSYVGLLLAVLMLVISGLAFWGASFANGAVRDQLAAQRITMPLEAAFPVGEEAYLAPFAGQPLDNGAAAKAYADHYILAHMNASSDGKTYSEVSAACTAAKKADPTSAETQQTCDLRESLFMGNTLRSMLLTAYAFGTIGTIASVGAVVMLVGGILMAILAILGLQHAKKAGDAPLDAAQHRAGPAA